MTNNAPMSLRIFLLETIDAISSSKSVTIQEVQENLSSGIATFLKNKFPDEYVKSNIPEMDEYYRQYTGVDPDDYFSKYIEQSPNKFVFKNENDGLLLLIALGLNALN